MNNRLDKKQRIRYFIMNLLSFASIFLILGIIVFQLLQTSIYSSVNQDLQRWSKDTDFLERQLERSLQPNENRPLLGGNLKDLPPNNFQQQVILWSKEGEIINETELGSRIYDFENLILSTKEINKIVSVQIKDSNERTLEFRSITIPVEDDDNAAYIQILINTDQIKGTVEQVKSILIICMLIFSLLSIALSYVLSKWSMRPILISWKKQQEFVENASHELRTPLTIIQAKLEKLFAHPNHTIMEESETIALSLNEVQRLSQLTDDLLLLARSDSNALTIDKEPVRINQFLKTITQSYEELAYAENKTVLIELGEEYTVVMDRKRIHQLLIILLDNALKYTTSGDQITIYSSIKNGEWLLKIIDTGLGIEDEKKEAVFQRFYRGEQSRNRKTGGYGIGLSIAKWIVTVHKGKIELIDTVPKGTTVVIRLPIK